MYGVEASGRNGGVAYVIGVAVREAGRQDRKGEVGRRVVNASQRSERIL